MSMSRIHGNQLSQVVIANLIQIRKSRFQTQTEFGKLFGVPRQIVANYERSSNYYISVDMLHAIGEAFSINPWDLTGELCPLCLFVPPPGFTCNKCGRFGTL